MTSSYNYSDLNARQGVLTKTALIVPCAGYGTRVGSPEAKELLLSPNTKKPLIDYVADLAKQYNYKLVLITRRDKISLIEYMNKKTVDENIQMEWVFVEKTKEWPESILKSEYHWLEKNLMILPDTEWQPYDIVQTMDKMLEDVSVVIADFSSDSLADWGVIRKNKIGFSICEKPHETILNDKPWGILGFNKKIGKKLFQEILSSNSDHQFKNINSNYKVVSLLEFKDLTRKN